MKANQGKADQKLLPPGWRWRKLSDLCRQDRKIIVGESQGTARLPYLGLENIEAHSGRIQNEGSTSRFEEGISTTFFFSPDHVLYGKLRPYLNKVALPGFEGRCTTEIIPLLPDNGVDRSYLGWLLRRRETVDAAMLGKTGSRMPRASLAELLKLSVPVPPYPEQKRIAGILNERMAAIDRARAAAEAQLEAAKALQAAYLRKAFPKEGGRLSTGWEWMDLDSICDVVNGFGFPEHLQGRKGLPYPFIKVSDMNAVGAEVVVSSASNFVDRETLDILGARIYPPGTVIFPKVGGALFTNKKRILGKDSCFDNNVMGLVPRNVQGDFLYFWFQTVDLRLLSNVQALPSIKQSRVAALRVPVPAVFEQKRIISELKGYLSGIEQIRVHTESQFDEINALPRALLRQAFMGEL